MVFLKSLFPRELTLDGMTIVVDCANGAAYQVAPAVFEELGAKVIPLDVEPDGRNINDGCGALHPEEMASDGPRRTAPTSASPSTATPTGSSWPTRTGEVVDGDAIMAIVARDLLRRGAPDPGDGGGHGDEQRGAGALHGRGGRARWCAPRWATATSSRRCAGAATTSAASSRATWSSSTTSPPATASARRSNLLAVMKRTGKRLSAAGRSASRRRRRRRSTCRSGRSARSSRSAACRAAIADVERALGADGRVLVRFSGTENKARVLVEGPDAAAIQAHAERIAEALRRAG